MFLWASHKSLRPTPPSAEKDSIYRISLEGIDRSGRVKFYTLETIYMVQIVKGWCHADDAYDRLDEIAVVPFESGRRGVSMRLLRYKRQGLLIRRKIRGRLTEYMLSQKGENRLIYFWKKFKLLEPPLGWQSRGKVGINNKKLAKLRFRMYQDIRSIQKKRLEQNRPLRTPKVRQVIKFESTLRKLREYKPRLRLYPRED